MKINNNENQRRAVQLSTRLQCPSLHILPGHNLSIGPLPVLFEGVEVGTLVTGKVVVIERKGGRVTCKFIVSVLVWQFQNFL